MTKNLTRAEAAAFLLEQDHYTIVSHRRPDGDTTGSSAALCRGLRQLGKTAHILENPELGPKFAHLHQGLTVSSPAPGDLLITTDVAAPNLLPKNLPSQEITLRLDHHGSGAEFSAYQLVDSGSASCAELIYDLLLQMGVTLDVPMAEAIYTGTATDTGCFRFANTTDHSFLVAAACTQAGANIYQMNQDYFETNSLARLKIQGWMVEHMKLLREGQLALCAIPLAVEQELGVSSDDMDNISSFPRSIAGVKMAATLRENADGSCKISVRAVPGLDAAKVCGHFGGGGHKGAAGGSIALPFHQAVAALEQAMLEET